MILPYRLAGGATFPPKTQKRLICQNQKMSLRSVQAKEKVIAVFIRDAWKSIVRWTQRALIVPGAVIIYLIRKNGGGTSGRIFGRRGL